MERNPEEDQPQGDEEPEGQPQDDQEPVGDTPEETDNQPREEDGEQDVDQEQAPEPGSV